MTSLSSIRAFHAFLKIPAIQCCDLSMGKRPFVVGVVLFIKRHGLAKIYPNTAVNYPTKFW